MGRKTDQAGSANPSPVPRPAGTGLYDMSRRMQKGVLFGEANIFTAMARRRHRDMGWMALAALFISRDCFYHVRKVMVITLQTASCSGPNGFVAVVFGSPAGSA